MSRSGSEGTLAEEDPHGQYAASVGAGESVRPNPDPFVRVWVLPFPADTFAGAPCVFFSPTFNSGKSYVRRLLTTSCDISLEEDMPALSVRWPRNCISLEQRF